MSKVFKSITIELGVSDILLINSGLRYIIKDLERDEIDKTLAQDLTERIVEAVNNNAIMIERGD